MVDLITNNIDIWSTAQTIKTNGRGRSADNQSLHGIKKLRELILELAVRGKLVPQDPNDEPASVLLERIAKERGRLVKEGKVKKQEFLPEISKEEEPFESPKGWGWTKLGTISLINPRNEAEDDSPASFVPMPLITTSHTGEHGQEDSSWGSIKQGYTHFANGDIGLAKITPCFENSKAVVFSNLRNGIGAGTTELHIARPLGETLCARYVLLYLKAPQFLLLGETKMTGTAGQKRVPKDFFAENPFPLPPLAEQHRIVAKVDELMALCDQLEQQQTDSNAAHQTLVETLLTTLTDAADQGELEAAWQRIANYFDTLFTTEHSIDQLKQTILQLAVMGKLVPQDPHDEPAGALLERIAKEKTRLNKEGRLKKQDQLPEITGNEKLFGIPSGWEWTRLGSIAYQITDGTHNTPTYVTDGIPFLSVKDMSSGYLDFSTTRLISREQHGELIKRCKPQQGDLLLTKVGTTGIPVLVETDKPFSIFVSVALIKFPQDQISGRFLALLIKSPLLKVQSEEGTEGIGNKNLVLRKIAAFSIVIPPLAEQHRIVVKVDELMALCDTLKTRLNDAQTTQIQLADAVVKQAVA